MSSITASASGKSSPGFISRRAKIGHPSPPPGQTGSVAPRGLKNRRRHGRREQPDANGTREEAKDRKRKKRVESGYPSDRDGESTHQRGSAVTWTKPML